MSTIVRALKFEVRFSTYRKEQRELITRRVLGASNDLTRASNKLISALFLIKNGDLPHPTEPPARPKPGQDMTPRKVPLATLAYRGLSGSWQPLGNEPCYAPYKDNVRVSGGVLSELASVILARIDTDLQEIRMGKKSLSTFRESPVPYRAVEVELRADGQIGLQTFGKEAAKAAGIPSWVFVRPAKLDASTNAILRRLRDPASGWKHGNARLAFVKPEGRRGRWMLSLSYSREDKSAELAEAALKEAGTEAAASTTMIAGVDIGIQHAAWISYVQPDGTPIKRPDIIQFPRNALRAVARLANERKVRSEFNRAPLGLREGRGRTRKLRVVDHIGDKVERINHTMIEQIAAAAVTKIKQRGASVMVLEDHLDWSRDKMHDRADRAATKSEAAKIRASYFRWHQGAMRVALKNAGEREGLRVVEIDPAWTSRTCHVCGLVWKRDYMRHKVEPGEVVGVGDVFGRVELRRFICSCGYDGHADHNAAINIARRGVLEIIAPGSWQAEKKKKGPRKAEKKENTAELLQPAK